MRSIRSRGWEIDRQQERKKEANPQGYTRGEYVTGQFEPYITRTFSTAMFLRPYLCRFKKVIMNLVVITVVS